MLSQPLIGAGYLIRGLKLLTAHGVKRFVAIPLLINVLVFSLLFWVLAGQFGALIDAWLPTLPDWLAWLYWLLWLVFGLAAALVLFFSFTIVANLIAAPFNGLLAEAVECHLGGEAPPSGESLAGAIKNAPAAIMDELRKLGYYVVWAIPLLILFWIPVANLFAPFLWALFSAWMLAVEYTDYPMGNHGLKAAEQRRRLRSVRFTSLGFGGLTLVATMTPILNFLVMPTAVAGASLFWSERLKQA